MILGVSDNKENGLPENKYKIKGKSENECLKNKINTVGLQKFNVLKENNDFVSNSHIKKLVFPDDKKLSKKSLENFQVNNDSINDKKKDDTEDFSNKLKRKYEDGNDNEFSKNKVRKIESKTISNLKEDHSISLKEEDSNIPTTVEKKIIYWTEPSKKDTEDLQNNSPLSTELPDWKSQLVKVKNVFKIWASQQNSLTRKTGSFNIVVAVPSDSDSNKVIAYYKESGTGKEEVGKAIAKMEKLVWKLAVIFGFEDSFAPTGKMYKGSIQVAHEGISLLDYTRGKNIPKNQIPISKEEIIRATIITIIFGMFDAHGLNIIVNKKGECKFFDNTRSLPNSNDFINRLHTGPTPSYRSGLLALSESYETLTSEQLEQVKEEIVKQQDKMTDVRKFLEIQIKINDFPPRWLDKDAIDAMEDRLDKMKEALNNDEVSCLRDLIFAAMPSLKFAAILQLLMFMKKKPVIELSNVKLIKKIQEVSLHALGFHFMNNLLENSVKKGVDPQKIKEWCESDDLTFEEIICKTSSLVNENLVIDEQKEKNLEYSKNIILTHLISNYNLDGKDQDVIEYLQNKTNDMVTNVLKLNGQYASVKIHDYKKNTRLLRSPGDFFLVTDTTQKVTTCWVVHKKNNEITFQEIQCTFHQNYIKLIGFEGSVHISHLRKTLELIESSQESN